jgi:hypothetical protein
MDICREDGHFATYEHFASRGKVLLPGAPISSVFRVFAPSFDNKRTQFGCG